MTLKTLRAVLTGAFFLFAAVHPTSAVVLEQGENYIGGTQIEVPELGVSFYIPQGWEGSRPEGIDFFVMSPDKSSFIFVFARQGNLDDMRKIFSRRVFIGEKYVLSPTSEPIVSFDKVGVPFQVDDDDGDFSSYGWARAGGNGSIIAFIGVGPATNGPALALVLQRLVQDVTFSEKSAQTNSQ